MIRFAQPTVNILLIEDNEADAFLLQEALSQDRRDRFTVHHALTVEEGAREYSSKLFDALLLDLHLPGISGSEAVNKIRQECPDMPIVVLTGLDDDENAVRLMEIGVQDYLVKGRYAHEVLPRSIRFSIERKRYETLMVSKRMAAS